MSLANQILIGGGSAVQTLVNIHSYVATANGGSDSATAGLRFLPTGQYQAEIQEGLLNKDHSIGIWLAAGAAGDYEIRATGLTNSNLLSTGLGQSPLGQWLSMASIVYWSVSIAAGGGMKDVELQVEIRLKSTGKILSSAIYWLIAERTAPAQQLLDHTLLAGPMGLVGLSAQHYVGLDILANGQTMVRLTDRSQGQSGVLTQALENWQRAANDITHVMPFIAVDKTDPASVLSFGGFSASTMNQLNVDRTITFLFPTYVTPTGKVDRITIRLSFFAGTVLAYQCEIEMVLDQGAAAASIS